MIKENKNVLLNNLIDKIFSSKYFLTAVLLIIAGIIIRISFMNISPIREFYELFVTGKSGFDTNQIAYSLADGKGYFSQFFNNPSGSRLYVITYLYSIYYLISRDNIIVLKIIKILEYLSGALLIIMICRKFFKNSRDKMAVFILLFYCLVPHFASLQINIIETGPLIVFVLFFLYQSVRILKAEEFDLKIALLWSISITLFYFTRSDLVFCIIFFFIIYIYMSVKNKKIFFIKTLLVSAILSSIILFLWIYQNYYFFGDIVLGRADYAINIWKGHHPDLEKLLPVFSQDALEVTRNRTLKNFEKEEDPTIHGRYADINNAPKITKAFYREISDYYKKYPYKLISRIFLKTYYFFYWDYMPVSKSSDGFEMDPDGNVKIVREKIVKRMFAQRLLHWIAWPVIVLSFFSGMLILRKTDIELFYTVSCIFLGYFLMIIFFSIPAVKNRIPIEAVMYIPCGLSFFKLYGKIFKIS